MKTGVVSIVNRTFSPITEIWWKTPAPDWDGKPAGAELIVAGMATDIDYTKTMGVKIIEGKDFSGVPADSANMLINEAAVKAMGLKNPIGTQFRYGTKSILLLVSQVISLWNRHLRQLIQCLFILIPGIPIQ